jgi:hypothetical protein
MKKRTQNPKKISKIALNNMAKYTYMPFEWDESKNLENIEKHHILEIQI